MATTPPKYTPPINLKIEVLPASDLLHPSRKQTLRNICRLINDSFAAHGHPTDNGDTVPGALFLRKRLIHDEELSTEMGPEALTAICIDETVQDDEVDADASNGSVTKQNQIGSYGGIVATASVKLWKGKVVDIARSLQNDVSTQSQPDKHITLSDQTLSLPNQPALKSNTTTILSPPQPTWNWELKLCASINNPLYRARGLITQCTNALTAELKRQQLAMRESNNPTGDVPIKLWSTSLEGTGNTEYWVRRGFVRVGEAEVAPKGTWMSTRDITICTLARVVE